MDSLFAFNAIGPKIKPITDHWSKMLQEYCGDLKTGSITPVQWQQQVEALYKTISLEELLQFIHFDNLAKGLTLPDLGVATRPVSFPKLAGLPEKTVFAKKLFGMQKDRAIIPHGHSNMASAHLVVKGEMHLRHYQKLHGDHQHLIIKPTIDKMTKPGESSSISDDKDNVHWFIANTPTAYTFDVIMADLNQKHYDVHNLDMYASQDLKNDTLKVPILDVETALKKYGKQHH